tara:strand:+ start:1830 stop:4358 length:2529 start_codon:yes stop_codon:yes gene_type:complete
VAKSRFIQNNFVSGELSPLLRGRTDIDQYYQGLQTAKNIVLVPQGGVKRRPGTQHIDTVLNKLERLTAPLAALNPTMPNGGTGSNINDGNDATTAATTVVIGTTNPYVVAQYDRTASPGFTAVFADLRQIKLSAFSSNEFVIQDSADAISWTTLAPVPLIGTNPQNFRISIGSAAQYVRLARVGATDLGSATVTLGEFNLITQTSTAGEPSESKLVDFSVTTDRNYLLSITDNNIRIFKNPGALPVTHVADVRIPLTAAQVSTVRDTQTESVMLLFHEDVPSQRLINLGTDADWFLDEVPFTNVPTYDFDDDLSPVPVIDQQSITFDNTFVSGDQYQIDVEGVLSKNITFAGDTTPDERNSTIFNMHRNLQDMPVYGETGVTVSRTAARTYRIDVSGESAKDFELYSGFPTSGTSKPITFLKVANGSPRKEPVWSLARGYPKTGCFFQGRLVLGGTKSKTASIFFSKSGSFFDYEIDDGDDDEGIFATISSRKLNEIIDVYPGRNLQVFTSGAEFSVTSTPVTPSSVGVTPQTNHGASYIEVADVDGSTIFVDRNGKTIYDFVYSFNEDAYVTHDRSVLSSHLIKQPTDMAMLSGTTSEDANWLFIPNTDGSVTILNTLRDQDINGFTQWISANSGFITNATVVDDQLYMIDKRTIAGNVEYHLGRWSFDHLMDDSIIFHPAPAATTITGLGHLQGETVQIVADGIVLPERTVVGSQITLTSEEIGYTNVEVGLNFLVEVTGMPLNTNIGSGENQMRIKRIVRMNIRVYQSYGYYVDGQPVPIREFGYSAVSPLDTSPNSKTGIIEDVLNTIGWTRDAMPSITAPDPTPVNIQMIEYEVESS